MSAIPSSPPEVHLDARNRKPGHMDHINRDLAANGSVSGGSSDGPDVFSSHALRVSLRSSGSPASEYDPVAGHAGCTDLVQAVLETVNTTPVLSASGAPVASNTAEAGDQAADLPASGPAIDPATAVAEVLAPVIAIDAPAMARRLREEGVKSVMEGAGYTYIGCTGPTTILQVAAEALERLLASDNAEVRERSALCVRFLPRDPTNRETLIAAGICRGIVALLQRGTNSAAAAAGTIGLTLDPSCVTAVLAAGAVLPLVNLLREGSDIAKEMAAIALGNLAIEVDGRAAVVDAGAVECLSGLLGAEAPRVREEAATLLWNITTGQDYRPLVVSVGAVEPLVMLLGDSIRGEWRPRITCHQEYPRAVREAACTVLALVRTNSRGELLHASSTLGCLPLEMIHAVLEYVATTPDCAVACAAGLWNLAIGPNHKAALVRAGALPPLVRLLGVGTDTGKVKAAAALWSLSAGPDHKAAVVAAGAVPPLVALLARGTDGAQEKAAGALQAIMCAAQHRPAVARAGGIAALVGLLRHGTAAAKEKAAGAMQCFVSQTDFHEEAVEAGAIPPLVAMLSEGTDSGKVSAVNALWWLALNPALRPAVVEAGAPDCLRRLLATGTGKQREVARGALGALA